jgi:hypothetical protein
VSISSSVVRAVAVVALSLGWAAACSLDRGGLLPTSSGSDSGVQARKDGGPSDAIAATSIDLISSEASVDRAAGSHAGDGLDVAGGFDALDGADSGSGQDAGADMGSGGVDASGAPLDGRGDDGPPDASPVDGAGGHVGGGRPQIVSIDFVGKGTPMAPTEIAGVIPAPDWNSASTTQGSMGALFAADGHATSASLAWSSDSLFSLGIADDPGNARMMNGYLDPLTPLTFASVTVSGLPDIFAVSGYDVYVYANGVVPAGVTRTGIYRMGAVVQSLTQTGNTPFDGVFRQASLVDGGNYLVFHGVIGTGFTLTATPGPAASNPRSPLNGIQIVSVATSP